MTRRASGHGQSRGVRYGRSQDRTGFTHILETLMQALPGVAGVVLVDDLGECVDYAGVLNSFELSVAAAHGQLELRQAMQTLGMHLGRVHSLSYIAHKRSYVACNLVDNYTLVIVYIAAAELVIKSRSLLQAAYDIRIEAGWNDRFGIEPSMERWTRLQVQARPYDKWIPRAIFLHNEWQSVTVLGTAVGLDQGERGFRVRTQAGQELTIVREVTGWWFGDNRT